MFARCGLRSADYRSARSVEDQPDGSLHSPGDQGIDEHCKHGGEFKYHAAICWRANQSGKGEQEQGGKSVDQGDDWAIGIGTDEFQAYAQQNERLEDSK